MTILRLDRAPLASCSLLESVALLALVGSRRCRYAAGTLDAWFVYLLRCGDGSIYCGIARDVEARLAQHAAGKGARYTRGRGPLAVCAVRRCATKGNALRLELAVKRLPRTEKERLVETTHFQAFQRGVQQRARIKAR